MYGTHPTSVWSIRHAIYYDLAGATTKRNGGTQLFIYGQIFIILASFADPR